MWSWISTRQKLFKEEKYKALDLDNKEAEDGRQMVIHQKETK